MSGKAGMDPARRVSFSSLLTLWMRNLGSFALVGVIAAVFWTVCAALQIGTHVGLFSYGSSGWYHDHHDAGTVTLYITIYIVATLASGMASWTAWAALEGCGLALVDGLHEKPKDQAKVDYKRVFSNFWSLSKCGTLLMLIITVLAFVLGGSGGFAYGAGIYAFDASNNLGQQSVLVKIIVGIMIVIPALVSVAAAVFIVKLALDYALAPCFVMDGHGATASLKLSKDAVKGNRLQLVRLHLLTFFLVTMPAAILFLALFPFSLLLWPLVAVLHHTINPLVYRSIKASSAEVSDLKGDLEPLLKSLA